MNLEDRFKKCWDLQDERLLAQLTPQAWWCCKKPKATRHFIAWLQELPGWQTVPTPWHWKVLYRLEETSPKDVDARIAVLVGALIAPGAQGIAFAEAQKRAAKFGLLMTAEVLAREAQLETQKLHLIQAVENCPEDSRAFLMHIDALPDGIQDDPRISRTLKILYTSHQFVQFRILASKFSQATCNRVCFNSTYNLVHHIHLAGHIESLRSCFSAHIVERACFACSPPLFHRESVLRNIDLWEEALSDELFSKLCQQRDDDGNLPILTAVKSECKEAILILAAAFPEGTLLTQAKSDIFTIVQKSKHPLALDLRVAFRALVFGELAYFCDLEREELVKTFQEALLAHFEGSDEYDAESLLRFAFYVNINVVEYIRPTPEGFLFLEHSPPYALCEINPRHFAHSLGNVQIPQCEKVKIQRLKDLFASINFTDPEQPGYKDPKRLIDENGQTITPEDLQENIDRYVDIIRAREHFQAAPQDPLELAAYFDALHNMACHLTRHLLQLTDQAEKSTDRRERDLIFADRNELLINLALAGEYCATRFMSTTQSMVIPLFSDSSTGTLKNQIRAILQELKIECLNKAMREYVRDSEDVLTVHIYNRFWYLLGQKLGLTASCGSYNDPLSPRFEEEVAWYYFNKFYTKITILERMEIAINGNAWGKKEIDPELIHDWFKDHASDYDLRQNAAINADNLEFIAAEEQVEKVRMRAYAESLQETWDTPDCKFSKIQEALMAAENLQEKLKEKLKILRDAGISPTGRDDIEPAVERAKRVEYQKSIPKDWDTQYDTFKTVQSAIIDARAKFPYDPEEQRSQIKKIADQHKIPYTPSLDMSEEESREKEKANLFLRSRYTPKGRISSWAIAQLLAAHDVLTLPDPVSFIRKYILEGHHPPQASFLEQIIIGIRQFYAEANELTRQEQLSVLNYVMLLDNFDPCLREVRTIDRMMSLFLRDAFLEKPPNSNEEIDIVIAFFALAENKHLVECKQVLEQIAASHDSMEKLVVMLAGLEY